MTKNSILVLGPTGGLGKFLLEELIRRKDEFGKLGAFVDTSRPQSTEKTKALDSLAEQGVVLVKGTYNSPNDLSVFSGYHTVIASLGNHAIKFQPGLIETAIAAGVKHWYPSEFGADLTVPGNWEERYYRDKVITRDFLKKKAAEHADFGYTYFLDGRFMEWAPIPHFGINVKTHTAHIVGKPEMLQSLIGIQEYVRNLTPKHCEEF